MSDAERRAYDEHLSDIMIQNDALDGVKLEGHMEGLVEGRKEGRKEESRNIAANMKNRGVDILFISEVTGLTAEEIEKL